MHFVAYGTNGKVLAGSKAVFEFVSFDVGLNHDDLNSLNDYELRYDPVNMEPMLESDVKIINNTESHLISVDDFSDAFNITDKELSEVYNAWIHNDSEVLTFYELKYPGIQHD